MADERFQRRLLKRLGQAAMERVRPRIVSYKGKPIQALQRALQAIVVSDTELKLRVPHFWAIYVHDGRKAPVYPQHSAFMIWWKDPRQDPRLNGGVTPERASSLRHLTTQQFRDAMRLFREAQESGAESPVVITPIVRRSTPPSPFFSNEAGGGMHGFVTRANRVGLPEFRSFALTLLKKELGVSTFVPAGDAVLFRSVKERLDSRL